MLLRAMGRKEKKKEKEEKRSQKAKQKPLFSLQFPFLHVLHQLNLSEYTCTHAHTTAYLKEKDLKNTQCTLTTQPLQKSSRLLFKTEIPRYFQHPYPQANFISTGF